ncbi:hypothetical protein EB796_001306 [Bugula neritina]|uniref:Uncharacterized protein n=1 Tax=Bugula neritina TaxID=10212 RepID=A0A7J7KQP3_BUGNE|nr:hypothetical protein EB796_001306 [Bugula neritina]
MWTAVTYRVIICKYKIYNCKIDEAGLQAAAAIQGACCKCMTSCKHAEQCQSHSECIHLGLGYQCIDSICHCQHGFTYMNTTNSCIAEYNSSCSSKADCTDTYGECRSGKCQCLDGYSYDARTKNCAGLLNAPCSSHELCTIPYSRCLPQLPTAGNRCCTCMQGYHTVNNQCQATHGLGCDLNGLCSDDQTECDVGKSNKCVCRSHHKYDGQTCRREY